MIRHPDALDVVAVGEALMDLISPDAESLEEAVKFLRTPGGAPANVAVGVARLGGQAGFIGAIGGDPFGLSLRLLLEREGIDISGLRTVSNHTTVAFVARNTGGIPDFVFYRGADAQLQPEDISLPLITRSSFLYVSSMALLSEPSASATLYAVEAAREAGILVSVDPNLRPSSWPSPAAAREAILPLLRSADVLKLNDEEAQLLADVGDLSEAMSALAGEHTLIVVTLGEEGCRWCWNGQGGQIPSPAVTVRDTTGAGDAFVGALLTELAAQGFAPGRCTPLEVRALEGALRFACAAGAVACTRPGAMTALPTRAEVEGLLL